jgi:hypothetical protein
MLSSAPVGRSGKTLLKKAVENFRRTRGVQLLLGLRHEILYRQFLGSAASKGQAFARSLSEKPERNYCFTIAFNTPWVIDVLTKAWQVFPTGTRLVVIDNSPNQEARASIEAICARRGVAYFGLPRNFETNPSRSHGVSQTWVFHNIVKHLKPDMFGFIDHDCFPVGPIDFARRIGGKIGYGAPLHARSSYLYKAAENEPGWYYWAGLCFYNFATVERTKLDFRNRLDIGMDTGGGNWPVLYSKHPIGEFEMAQVNRVAVGVEGTIADYQLYDEALFHVGGASYRSGAISPDYRRLLSDHIWKTYLGGIQDRLISI